MGNAYFSLSVFILFFLILITSNSCFASDQTTSNAPSLHDGNASTKLVSITSYNAKTRLDDPKEVDNSRPFGGRKMKSNYESAMVVRSLIDNEEHVRISSAKKHYYINNVKGGDEKGDSKYEANSKNTKDGRRIRGHNQKTTANMDSFVACADYPSPHHHPPKNN